MNVLTIHIPGPVVVVLVIIGALIVGLWGFDAWDSRRYRRFGP